MLRADKYPITFVEFDLYMTAAKKILGTKKNESLKGFLSLNPEHGEVVPGTNGIRHFMWPGGTLDEAGEPQVVYFFRDLNIPVYLLAIYPDGESVDFDEDFGLQLAALVEELVREHMLRNAHVVQLPKSSA